MAHSQSKMQQTSKRSLYFQQTPHEKKEQDTWNEALPEVRLNVPDIGSLYAQCYVIPKIM